MKKAITELSTEELVHLLGKNPPNVNSDVIYNWPTDVMDFISFYNLKQGTEHVTTKLLYRLYRHWSKDPLIIKAFVNTLTDIFPSSRIGKSTTIMLDKKTLHISQEVYKYLETLDKTKSKGWTKHFNTFLEYYSIKKGGLYIKNNVLYSLYDKWTYGNKNRRPLGYKQFNKFCKVFFKQKIVDNNRWSAVDNSIEQYLTDDLIQLMKATRNGKKTNKKK